MMNEASVTSPSRDAPVVNVDNDGSRGRQRRHDDVMSVVGIPSNIQPCNKASIVRCPVQVATFWVNYEVIDHVVCFVHNLTWFRVQYVGAEYNSTTMTIESNKN